MPGHVLQQIPYEAVGWTATLICVWLSIRFATVFLRENPRLFTAMALFACAWALVLSFYAILPVLRDVANLPQYAELPANFKLLMKDLPDLDTELASFLWVYTGGLFLLQSEAESAPRRPINIVYLQRLALRLLILIAVPRAFGIPGIADHIAEIFPPLSDLFHRLANLLSLDHVRIFVAGAADVFGLACLLWGILSISSTRLQQALIIFAIGIYAYLKLSLAIQRWDAPDQVLSEWLTYQFAAAKIFMTLVLGGIVADHGMSKSLRMKGPGHWISRFFYFS
jgi:hypothetical protein